MKPYVYEGRLYKMEPMYNAECYKCGDMPDDYIGAKNMHYAKKQLRKLGWRYRNGVWYCPTCASKGVGLERY